MTRRWLAQRVGTREWLSKDLPIEGAPEQELSGPGALALALEPEVAGLETSDGSPMFDKWGTYLYLEEYGEIRWAGVVIDAFWDGPRYQVELAGFSTYPHGQPYTGDYERVKVDPADVKRHIWAHLQSFTGGDMGMEVVGTTTARVGVETKEQDKLDENGNPLKDGNGDRVKETVTVPYELRWFDYPDCGREIDALTKEADFEWVEVHEWNADQTDVLHRIVVADRLGAMRSDLSFEQGVNVVNVVPFEEDGDEYATEIAGIGAGEGKQAIRSSAAVVRPRRLRRARALLAKDVTSRSRLDALTRAELRAADLGLQTTTITVRDHPHAPLGSWELGDHIRVVADAAWLGEVDVWQRIVGWRMVSDSTAVLTLAPSRA